MKIKNTLKIIVSLILIILISIIVLLKNEDSNEKNTKLQFLSSEILLTGKVDEEITLPTIFVTNIKTNPYEVIEDVKLINSNNIEIVKWEIEDGNQYKKIKLYNISLTLKIVKEGYCNIQGLNLLYKDGTEHEIKFHKFIIDVFSNTYHNLTVASKETYLASNNSITFDLKNIAQTSLLLDQLKVNTNDIIIKTSNSTINNETIDGIKNHKLNTNDIMNIDVEYNINDLPVDLVFIRPYIEYTINDQPYNESVTQGSVFGLPFSEDKMEKIYKQFFTEN